MAHVKHIKINIVSYLNDCEKSGDVQVREQKLEVEKLPDYLSVEAGAGKCPRSIGIHSLMPALQGTFPFRNH